MNLSEACDPGGRRNAQGNLCFHKESGYGLVVLFRYQLDVTKTEKFKQVAAL